MSERQLNLFTVRSVLCERFDLAFFRSIPRSPGVYFMSDDCDRVIYVGKANSLRERLGSYRYVDHRSSRKTARLVARVTKIRWQVCPSEEAALLEENRLLRELRPRFNRVNTWPKAYRFVRIHQAAGRVQLSLVGEIEGECFGAFKGTSRQTFAALLRLLASLNAPYSALPRRLICDPAPTAFDFDGETARNWLNELQDFLRGECDRLLRCLQKNAEKECAFHDMFRAADLQIAENFFRLGPRRNYLLRSELRAGTNVIAPEDLDDWIVRGRRLHRANAPISETSRPSAIRSQA